MATRTILLVLAYIGVALMVVAVPTVLARRRAARRRARRGKGVFPVNDAVATVQTWSRLESTHTVPMSVVRPDSVRYRTATNGSREPARLPHTRNAKRRTK